jgi:hypothetical protein
MKIRSLFALAFLASATLLSASPQKLTNPENGPTVAVVSGAQGPLRLVHDGAVVKEVPFDGPWAAAVVLGGPLDSLEWDGAEAQVIPQGDDPEGAGRKALAGRTEDLVFLMKPDGAVDALKAPDGWVDGTAAASAEE